METANFHNVFKGHNEIKTKQNKIRTEHLNMKPDIINYIILKSQFFNFTIQCYFTLKLLKGSQY